MSLSSDRYLIDYLGNARNTGCGLQYDLSLDSCETLPRNRTTPLSTFMSRVKSFELSRVATLVQPLNDLLSDLTVTTPSRSRPQGHERGDRDPEILTSHRNASLQS